MEGVHGPSLHQSSHAHLLGVRRPAAHHFLHSSALFRNPSPDLHTYNSEWLDSPDTLPLRRTHLLTRDMSPVAQATPSKYETPSKQKHLAAYVTPLSEQKHHGEATIDARLDAVDKLLSPAVLATAPAATVSNFDIFWAILNDITGKDKLAKVGQYTLRLLLYHSQQTETYLSDASINSAVIRARYNDKGKQLDLLRNFLKHPQDFVRIVAVLACSVFNSKLEGMVKGLSTYRQFLRFGKTPFRVRNLYNKISLAVDRKTYALDVQKIANKTTLGDFTSLYYGINDESLLLFKLNFFSNKSFHAFVARHESLAWYYETLLALYNAYIRLQQLQDDEMQIQIQIQVKKRARAMSKQLLGPGSVGVYDEDHQGQPRDAAALNEIKFKKNNCYLDIYKNLADLVFNLYTVFNAKLPFDTMQIWMGIAASTLSTVKIYRETKKKLVEGATKKQLEQEKKRG